jgi:hypothetical protein
VVSTPIRFTPAWDCRRNSGQADRGDIEPLANPVDHLVTGGNGITPGDRRIPCLLPLDVVEDCLAEDRHVRGRFNAETHHTLFGAHRLNSDIDAGRLNLFTQTARDYEHGRVSFPYSTAAKKRFPLP